MAPDWGNSMSILLISMITGVTLSEQAVEGTAATPVDKDARAETDLANGLFGRTGPAEREARGGAKRSWRGRPWRPDGLMTAA